MSVLSGRNGRWALYGRRQRAALLPLSTGQTLQRQGRFTEHEAFEQTTAHKWRPSETRGTTAQASRGNLETSIAFARSFTGTHETSNTFARPQCRKNKHFGRAKVMAVSPTHEYRATKVTAVSTPRRYKQAKATGVSDNRATWSTGPGCGARGQQCGPAAVPVGNTRYKRRQTGAISSVFRELLLQTSSICAQKSLFSAKEPSD